MIIDITASAVRREYGPLHARLNDDDIPHRLDAAALARVPRDRLQVCLGLHKCFKRVSMAASARKWYDDRSPL